MKSKSNFKVKIFSNCDWKLINTQSLIHQSLFTPPRPSEISFHKLCLNWLCQLFSWQILKGSQDFLHTFSMALYHKWDVKNGFAYVLTFFSLISDGLGSVKGGPHLSMFWSRQTKRDIFMQDMNIVYWLRQPCHIISYYAYQMHSQEPQRSCEWVFLS